MPYEDEEYELSGYGYGAQIEEVGADEDELENILGAMDLEDEYEDGDGYELGARKRSSKRRRVVRKPRAVLRPIQPTRLHDLPLPLNRTTIPAGQTINVVLQPQLPFKPYRLSIPSVLSGQLVITDVRVGNASQFVAAGEIPVECFDTDATLTRLKGDTAVPGVDIILSVSNPTADDRVLVGMIVGDVAQR